MLSVIRLIANYLERGTAQRTSMPNGVFNTSDGQINITMVRPGDWKPFCESIDRMDLFDDPRFSTHKVRGDNLDELYTLIRPVIAASSTDWLAQRLTACGIMNGRVIPVRGTGEGDRYHLLVTAARRAGAGADAQYPGPAAAGEWHATGARTPGGRAYKGYSGRARVW